MNRILLSGLAGVVLFVWGFVAHGLLPFHDGVFHAFGDETRVAAVLAEQGGEPGVYYLPIGADQATDRLRAFVNLQPPGAGPGTGQQIAVGLLIQILAAFVGITLVAGTPEAGYARRVGRFALLGLIIGFSSQGFYWNWFGFPSDYAMVMILDNLIGWTLAGLAVAGLMGADAGPELP
ncbi:MAG: hypothetical protein GWM93_19280 [Gemmatimonadetes bacterium]|uniref:Uncharacterized protein n=1 Tax=Candidatus Kutchimonas denitrificans TaxID=3056748 RepID=A0AAE5CCD4_9BACT|nr:hypothetical protein [Gemmatimonadota bacterium]NIR75768.1 hypothetical protein [Candidatus Kutchimonas denitrificans]NIT68793.1 hypothetical protein [Gemmatimonadota bacterium]NIW77518.1 hypothetical protein [Gemmatimonadota bacterium]NIY37370.1 hypothetical protein [Gemmatimonadota bacterium]